MIRPRGTTAAFGADMYMVFCDPAAADEAAAAGDAPDIRVPHAPQNAKPGLTIRPQLGQGCPSTVACSPADVNDDDGVEDIGDRADGAGARSAAAVGAETTGG